MSLLSSFARVNSQMIISKLKLQQVELSKALEEVENLTEYDFVFSYDDVKGYKVSVDLESRTLEDSMGEILKGLPFEYRTEKDIVIVSFKKDPSTDQDLNAEKVITGKVVDTKGQALPGVTVIEKGTTNGVSTGMDGDFSLILKNPNAVLVVSCIGMKSKEIKANGKTLFKITLQEDTQTIGEVTVTTGYQKIDRRLFTGAASKIKGAESKVEGIVDVSRMLEGKSAGVQVQNVSGTFGTAPKIRIRNSSSIYGDQKPLWVVDGVVLEDVVNVDSDALSSGDSETLISSSVAGINSDDIESFQILKDAAATALYGARAMNGVIVITTKKGKKGIAKVNFSYNTTMKMKPNYSQYNIMNSKDQMGVYNEMENKGWLNHSDISKNSNGGVYLKMYDEINRYDPNTGFGLENTPEARAKYLQKFEMANTDWFDLLFNNSIAQEYSVSLSSGTEKSQTYISTSFYDDQGWSLNSGVKRYTANFKHNMQIKDNLKIGFSTVGSMREQDAPGTTNRVDNVFDGSYTRSFDINPFSYALNTSRAMRAYDENGDLEFYKRDHAPFNILQELKNNKLKLNVLDFKIQTDLEYKYNKNFTYNFIASIRYVKSTREHSINENSNAAEAYRMAGNSTLRDRNSLLYTDPEQSNAEPDVILPRGGFYDRHENFLKSYYLRNTINFNKTYDDTHIVNVLAGQEVKYADRQNFFNNGPGYQFNSGGVPFIDYRYYKQALESNKEIYSMKWSYDRFVAYFLNAGYSYKGKYTFNGTVRMDGSNQLGESTTSRWLPTWNVSASWNVAEEDFMKDGEIFDYLKLRATYGLTASMGSAHNSTAIFKNKVTNRPYLSEKESGIEIKNLENSDLTWEKQNELNMGVDFGILNGRMNISSDVYFRQGFDLIGVINTSGIGGERLKLGNYADMTTSGIELSISSVNIKKGDFKWSSSFNIAKTKNEITKLESHPNVFELTRAGGAPKLNGPVRGLYSIPSLGLDEYGMPTFTGPDGEPTNDINLQSIDTDYLKYEGPVDPTFSGGLGNTFKYKNFSLNTFVAFSGGNKIRLNPIFSNEYSDLDAMSKEFKNRWTLVGDEKYTKIPAIISRQQNDELGSVSTNSYYNYSTDRVADGGFVKLKSVSLDYRIPKALVNKYGLSNASIKFQATNLFLIYSDKKLNGQDPEFFSSGGVALPQPKQFTLSLKVGL